MSSGLAAARAASEASSAGSSEPPKFDLAALLAEKKKEAAEKRAAGTDFNMMRLKLLADEERQEASDKQTGKKKTKPKGKPSASIDNTGKDRGSPSKVDKLRSEVAASKGEGASVSGAPAQKAAAVAAPEAAAVAAPELAAVGAQDMASVTTPAAAAAPQPADSTSEELAPLDAITQEAAAAKAAEESAAAQVAEEAAAAKVVEEAAAAKAAAAKVAEEVATAKAAEVAAAAKAEEEAAVAKAAKEAAAAAKAAKETKVYVRYNHKNALFKVAEAGRQLDFSLVDAKYCLSYVLKGEWSCRLKHAELGKIELDGGRLRMGKDDEGDPIAQGTFSGLRLHDDDGKGGQMPAQYVLEVVQDPTLANAPREAYKGSSSNSSSMAWREGSRKEGCSCLYGNPCAVPDNCNDWRNRFEVAKRNGGKPKGFPSVAL